jgi:hypothetical protein
VTDRTISQLEDGVSRLPIDVSNFGLFEALLGLPYDLFRPIMDMLLDGVISPEDLTDTGGNTLGGSALLADSAAAAAAFQRAAYDVGPLALAARAAQLVLAAGSQSPYTLAATASPASAGSVAVARDQTAVAVDPATGAPVQSFAPGTYSDSSYDSSVGAPNAIQLLRAGNVAAAQKAASAEFAGAMNSEVS